MKNLPIANNSNTQLIVSVDLADSYYQTGRFDEAIALWLKQLTSTTIFQDAIIHTKLASAYRKIGQVRQAIEHLQAAVKIYQVTGNQQQLVSVMTDLAQSYIALGQYNNAIKLLQDALIIAQKNHYERIEVVAQGVLGNAFFIAGDVNKAILAYQASLDKANFLNEPVYITNALNNLGNALNKQSQRHRSLALIAARESDRQEEARLKALSTQEHQQAYKCFNRAVKIISGSGSIEEAQALINLASFWRSPSLFDLPEKSVTNDPKTTDYLQQASVILQKLPATHSSASALIKLAMVNGSSTDFKIANLEKAINIVKTIGDSRTLSYAAGVLGQVYEQAKQYQQAMALTRQAIFAAQQVNAIDSLYRWQWQAGKIYVATQQLDAGILSYKQAIATLQSLRSDIVAASSNLQSDLLDEVEPLYRELIELLLAGQPTAAQLEESLQIMDLLRLSQLQNYFGDNCIQLQQNTSSTLLINHQVVISSIVLKHKAYILLRLPNGVIKHYSVEVGEKELEDEILQFRTQLEDFATNRYLAGSQKLYNLLIRPLESELSSANIKSLVFINDGLLRNISMAALHDGKQFLVEKYAIAISLGFNLPEIQPLSQKNQAAIFGLTVEIPPFAALKSVATETQEVQSIIGGSRFLDRDFTFNKLQQQLLANNSSILHLATHGKFGATADNTFLQAFDTRINLKQFEDILRQKKRPIDLLTLSACQTAVGDSRSTLGLAGVAARNGVKNVLASLWSINDADTVSLIEDFYKYMRQSNLTPVEALRAAQLKLIANPDIHPSAWFPFILITNK
ncbi:MAG TPA: CHAT domain-containing protein [Oculatellaceae cyanobacterium]